MMTPEVEVRITIRDEASVLDVTQRGFIHSSPLVDPMEQIKLTTDRAAEMIAAAWKVHG